MYEKPNISLLTSLFVIFIFGCTQLREGAPPKTPGAHPMADRSIITGIPCSPPCWYGIELGRNTNLETIAVLNNLSFVKQESIQDMWGDITFNCVYPTGDFYCGKIEFHNSKVQVIRIAIAFPLTFETLVNKVGKPDFVIYGLEIGGSCSIQLRWIQHKLLASYLDSDPYQCISLDDGNTLDTSIQISVVSYSNYISGLTCTPYGQKCIPWPGPN